MLTAWHKWLLLAICCCVLAFAFTSAGTSATVSTCSLDGLAASSLSIPPYDPDAPAVTSISLTGANFVMPSAEFGAFCAITGEIKTINATQKATNPGDNESTIQIEVRLPSTWNGDYLQYGGGGFDGSIAGNTAVTNLTPSGLASRFFDTSTDSPLSATYLNPAQGFRLGGYAIAATDSGHTGDGAEGFLNNDRTINLDRVINYQYRSRHLLAVIAKQLINNYYGQPPLFSIHSGGSNGGRNGLMEAARYPNDFDGILSANPATSGRSIAAFVKNEQAQFPGGFGCDANHLSNCLASQVLTTTRTNNVLPLIDAATMAKCDPADGLTDGIISDPASCHFDPEADPNLPTCPKTPTPTCLTPEQKKVLKTIYSDTRDSHGRLVYPGFNPGYENGGLFFPDRPSEILGPSFFGRPAGYFLGEESGRYLLHHDPKLTIQDMDLNTVIHCVTRTCNGLDPALFNPSPNLTAFKINGGTYGQGGKLLIGQGLGDWELGAQHTIDYYNSVVDITGGLSATRSFARLYEIPGLGHNQPLSSTTQLPTSSLTYIELAIRFGFAAVPDEANSILAVSVLGGPAGTTRPICAYPFRARYIGSGSIGVASNFRCERPARVMSLTPDQ